MKVLSQGSRLSISPFRRRHPTSEEIVEEVYRRVQQQQQLMQEDVNPKARSNYVTKISPPTSNTSVRSGGNRSSVSSHSPESRTDTKSVERMKSMAKNDSRQKTRSITPFARRKNFTTDEKQSSFDVTQLVAEYTSHNPGRVILDSPTSQKQSTTFITVEEKVDNEITHSKNSRPESRGKATTWASIRRKKSLESTDSTLHHRNTARLRQKSSQSSTNVSEGQSQEKTAVSRPQRDRKKMEQGEPSLVPVKSSSRQARSMSPFFRRNKQASDLIAEAKSNAMELSRLSEQPSKSMVFRGDRSLSGIVEADTKKPISQRPPSPLSPPRRARSLSPFSRRKSAHEVIEDVYRKMEIDYSNSTTGSSNDEDGVEIVLAGITDPASPNHGFLRKRTQPSPTAINVLCNDRTNKQHNTGDQAGGLQTIATVLFKEPSKSVKTREDNGTKRNEKSIRGRKSILISKTKPEPAKITPAKVDTTADLNVSASTVPHDANLKASPFDTKKKRRALIPKFKSSVVTQQTDKNGLNVITEPQSPPPRLRLDLVPPSSIAVGGRSRVSELSAPNPPPKRTTAIPLSSRVKTRSLGERSLAEIQTALEKVQKELTGATKTGQTIPRDLVMEKLLAVADTIEAPADRNNFLRKLSRLGSTTLSRSSGDGVTTSDDSDSSDDEDTSTDRYDTSGDESSFARWTVKRGKGKRATVGQWTRMLEALGLNGLWDDDIDLDDLDISRESIDENDDRDLTDDETTDRTRTPTPPIVQKLSFTGFIGQIASMGSFRDDAEVAPKKTDAAAQRAQQVQSYEESQKRIAIEDEERMLRELEEMDKKIQAEKQLLRKTQASERLKKLAENLKKENERLDRGKMAKHDTNDEDIPESVIEMYVQELSAESRRAITNEQRLRRVVEEEITKQKLVDSVLNKVQEEKLANTMKGNVPATMKNEISVNNSEIYSVPSTSPSKLSKLGTSRDAQSLVNNTAQSTVHQQLSKSNTRATFGSARSRFTAATSVKRSLLGSFSQTSQRDQISASNTGTTLGSASLISQPQMTLSTITGNTGYTYGTGPSPTHKSYSIDGVSYNQNESIRGSTMAHQINSVSLLSDDQETYCGNQSAPGVRSETPQSSKTSRSGMTKQSQQIENHVQNNSVLDSNFDSNDDSYDDALSVGSIESHQFDTGCQSSVGTGLDTEQTTGSQIMYNFRLADDERS